MFKKIGHRFVTYDATQEGGSGGGDGNGAHPVAPWSGASGPWTIGEGEGAKPWYSFVPEDGVRATLEAKAYANPAELAVAYHNLTKLQRNDPTVVGLPGEGATPEEMSAFYNRLGRPETPDKYDFKFAEGVAPDDGLLKFARSAFHDIGLNGKQAQALADKWNAFVSDETKALNEAATKANADELSALQTQWGPNLEENKASGLRVAKSLGLTDAFLSRIENKIGDAAVIELLALIGKKSAESGSVLGGNGGDPNDPANMTPQQAQTRIDTLRSDAAFNTRLTNANDPGHKAAVAELEKLYARI